MNAVTKPAAMTGDQRGWYDAACARIDALRLRRLNFDITDIHSPTGATRAAGEFMAGYLSGLGVEATYQPMNDQAGNVHAAHRGSGGGASLMLYAPIDTHLEGDESDLPWAGPAQTVDMAPRAKLLDDWVYGLGASNPKAMIASLVEAFTCVVEAGIPIMGDLMVAFADGGMPVLVPKRGNFGLSNGVRYLVESGVRPDFCVIMKPWDWVFHEEPGLAWFRITVRGTMGYAGVPRGTPGFRGSIVPAANLILELEDWLQDYAERNTSGCVRPEGWISALRAGWPERLSFPSAATEIYFDVRVNPRTPPAEVEAQFAEFMDGAAKRNRELEVDWEMFAAVPGGTTDPDNWIVQSARRGWEEVHGKAHGDPPLLGGQTDGAALRDMGIATARIGWPWPPEGSPEPLAEGLGGMGATYIPDLLPTIRAVIYTIVDTCTRTRDELGL